MANYINFDTFLPALTEQLNYQTDRLMFPLEQIHTVAVLGPGQDRAWFEYMPSGFAFSAVTTGTLFTTAFPVPIVKAECIPTMYEAQTILTRRDLDADTYGAMNALAANLAKSIFANTMSQLQLLYDDHQVSAAATGATLTISGLLKAKQDILSSGVNGPITCVVNPLQFGNLLADMGQNYGPTALASNAIGNGEVTNIWGINIVQSDVVATTGGCYRAFIGAQDAVGVCYGFNSGPQIIVQDASHYIVGLSYMMGVKSIAGTAATNSRARWLKTL